jgi:hypothetical protein
MRTLTPASVALVLMGACNSDGPALDAEAATTTALAQEHAERRKHEHHKHHRHHKQEHGLEVVSSFTGATYLVDSFVIPPDTLGAVGPEHIVELVNGRYSVYLKRDHTLVQTADLNEFWANAGVTPSFTFDSRLLYDSASDRWFASSLDITDTLFLAVSKSCDPTAGWVGFSIPFRGPLGNTADFPTLGLNKDGVFLYSSGAILVVPKADLLATPPTIANATNIASTDLLTPTGSNLQSIVNLNDDPMPESVLATFDTAGTLRRWLIEGPVTAPTLNGADGLISVPPYSDLGNVGVPQLGSSTNLNPGDVRFSSSVVQQGGSYWAVHTINVDGRAAQRWYEIDASTLAVLQSGLIADPVRDFYMGSIAVNPMGDVIIAFNGSSANEYADVYVVHGSTVGGVTTFSAPLLLQSSVAAFTLTGGASRARWGDYSATVVDPTDPATFWTFQEWVSAEDVWSTQIIELRVAD